jgi:hypothetical protein
MFSFFFKERKDLVMQCQAFQKRNKEDCEERYADDAKREIRGMR